MLLDGKHVRVKRRLNLLWHSVLPGGVLAVLGAMYMLVHYGNYAPPVMDDSIADKLPLILGGILLITGSAALFLKGRLPQMVNRGVGVDIEKRVTGAMFVVLGAADAPAIAGIGVYMLLPLDWLAFAIAFYSVAAGIVFKPDFQRLLSQTEDSAGADWPS